MKDDTADSRRSVDTASMGVRRFGQVNWLGMRTLYVREVHRFMNVATQTIAAPVATAGLFMLVFTLAFAARRGDGASDIPFEQFLAPGILMMTVIQNAFANTSSSMGIAKVQGNIVDTLMPPLSAIEILVGYVGGGVTRGLLCAFVVGVIIFPLIGLGVANPLWALLFVLLGSTMMALMGLMSGIYMTKFDQMAAVTNFVITPLSFLSGTFYSISVLPEPFHSFSLVNPFFYAIDGFRYGVLGSADANPWLGLVILLAANGALGYVAWSWLVRGYRLKG
ncbi:MAG: ABC transporter permease [Pseudomonadota bacterium]